MQAIDHEGILADIVTDESLKIPRAHLDTKCKIHQGKETCRYICLGVNGFVCTKNTKMKEVLDERVEEGKIGAQGDNCAGMMPSDNQNE